MHDYSHARKCALQVPCVPHAAVHSPLELSAKPPARTAHSDLRCLPHRTFLPRVPRTLPSPCASLRLIYGPPVMPSFRAYTLLSPARPQRPGVPTTPRRAHNAPVSAARLSVRCATSKVDRGRDQCGEGARQARSGLDFRTVEGGRNEGDERLQSQMTGKRR